MSGCSSSCLRVQAPHRTGSIPGATLAVTLQPAALHSRQPRILERGSISPVFRCQGGGGKIVSSYSCRWPRLCCAGCVHTPPVGPISKRGFLHFATQRQLYRRSPRLGSALMMLQPLSFVDNGQFVVLRALAGPLLKFPAPLTSPTKNPPIVLLMGCQDRPGELKTNALTVTSCPRLGTRDSDVGGNRYTNWNLWH